MPVLGSAAVAASTSSGPEFTTNFSARTLRKWRKALGVADTVHSARILWLQDSIGLSGSHDGAPGTIADEMYRRLRLSPQLTPFPGAINDYGMSFASAAAVVAPGPLLLSTTGTGWSAAGRGPAAAFGLSNTGVAGDRLYFQRSAAVSGSTAPTGGAIRVAYRAQAGGGGFTVVGTGGTLTQASTAGAGAVANGSIAMATFNVQGILTGSGSYLNLTGNGPVEIVGVEVLSTRYLNQLSATDIKADGQLGITWSKLAQGGKKVDDFITTAAFEYIDFYQPDLTMIMLQANSINAEAGTVYGPKLDTLVAHLVGIGSDVVVLGTPPPQIPSPGLGSLPDFITASKAVCTTRGAIYYDTFARWGSWDEANADGYMNDSLHPLVNGTEDLGRALAEMLLHA